MSAEVNRKLQISWNDMRLAHGPTKIETIEEEKRMFSIGAMLNLIINRAPEQPNNDAIKIESPN